MASQHDVNDSKTKEDIDATVQSSHVLESALESETREVRLVKFSDSDSENVSSVIPRIIFPIYANYKTARVSKRNPCASSDAVTEPIDLTTKTRYDITSHCAESFRDMSDVPERVIEATIITDVFTTASDQHRVSTDNITTTVSTSNIDNVPMISDASIPTDLPAITDIATFPARPTEHIQKTDDVPTTFDATLGIKRSTEPENNDTPPAKVRKPRGRKPKKPVPGDILKEKFATLSENRRVKTTKELVASVRAKSSFADLYDKHYDATTNDGDEAMRTKGDSPKASDEVNFKIQHIEKFLQSQSELQHTREISKGGASSDQSTEADAGNLITGSCVPAMEHQLSQSSDSDTMTASEEVIVSVEKEIEEILSQLPVLNVDEICWEDTMGENDMENVNIKEVTDDDVRRLHEEHIEGLNGNINDGARPGEIDFREWHETLSKRSYHGEFLHILPYVDIS